MRIFIFFIPLILAFRAADAQITLVPKAIADTFDLSCNSCTLQVTDMALVRGRQNMPINLRIPVKENLLHWRYFDDIIKEYVLMDEAPSWTQGTQLADALSDEAPMSLHLNLELSDSSGQRFQILLLLSGLTKQHLKTLPFTVEHTTEEGDFINFYALILLPVKDNKKEAYDCQEGTFVLDSCDLHKKKMSGSFEITGNKIGLEQKAYFQFGVFKN